LKEKGQEKAAEEKETAKQKRTKGDSVILAEIPAENKQGSGSVIPFLVTDQSLGWTPKRLWPPLLNRSVDSIHLSPSTCEHLPQCVASSQGNGAWMPLLLRRSK
jgi:hypothetical protein